MGVKQCFYWLKAVMFETFSCEDTFCAPKIFEMKLYKIEEILHSCNHFSHSETIDLAQW